MATIQEAMSCREEETFLPQWLADSGGADADPAGSDADSGGSDADPAASDADPTGSHADLLEAPHSEVKAYRLGNSDGKRVVYLWTCVSSSLHSPFFVGTILLMRKCQSFCGMEGMTVQNYSLMHKLRKPQIFKRRVVSFGAKQGVGAILLTEYCTCKSIYTCMILYVPKYCGGLNACDG